MYFPIINLDAVYIGALIYSSGREAKEEYVNLQNWHNKYVIVVMGGSPIYGEDFIHEANI